MGTSRKHSSELQERATRLAMEARRDPDRGELIMESEEGRVDVWVRERARLVARYRQARNLVGVAFVAGLAIAAMMVLVPSTRIEGWSAPWILLLIALSAVLLIVVVLVRRYAVGRSGVGSPDTWPHGAR